LHLIIDGCNNYAMSRGLEFDSVGIVGGMGWRASTDFQTRLGLEAAKRGVLNHLQCTTDFFTQPPMVFENGSPKFPLTVDPILLYSFNYLEGANDIIVCPTNTVELFYDQIIEKTGRKFLSMVDLTIEEVEKRGISRVGVLAYGTTLREGLYQKKLSKLGIASEEAPREFPKHIE
jgi:aspartate racemase